MRLQWSGTAKPNEASLAGETDAGSWTEVRNGVPLGEPYVWRGQRNRLQAITRSRVELGLADSPD